MQLHAINPCFQFRLDLSFVSHLEPKSRSRRVQTLEDKSALTGHHFRPQPAPTTASATSTGTPGVNFINILRTTFLYQSSLRSYSLVTFWLWRKYKWNFVQKTRAQIADEIDHSSRQTSYIFEIDHEKCDGVKVRSLTHHKCQLIIFTYFGPSYSNVLQVCLLLIWLKLNF